MSSQLSQIDVREWRLPEILLVAGACFALAAVGFFLAVFLQIHTPASEPTVATLKPISAEDKVRAMEGTAAQNSATTSNAQAVSQNQASANDSRAAAKLEAMQGSK